MKTLVALAIIGLGLVTKITYPDGVAKDPTTCDLQSLHRTAFCKSHFKNLIIVCYQLTYLPSYGQIMRAYLV